MLVPRQIIPEYASYLRIERAMSENTVSSYVSDLTLFFDSLSKAPEEISADDIMTYFSDRRSISKRTQARILSAMRSFFNYLILEGYITDNPCDRVDAPKTGRRLPEVLSVENVDAMLDVCHQQDFFLNHEKGLIAAAEFREKIRERIGKLVTDAQIDQAWNSFLVTIPTYKLDLLLNLRKNYIVYLLSNTNDIHWEWSCKHAFPYKGFRVEDYFEHIFLSFEVLF